MINNYYDNNNNNKDKNKNKEIDIKTENSIFITQKEVEESNNDISGKITLTNVLNTIPTNSIESRIPNWRDTKKVEWRWRFLRFNNRRTVEISYLDRMDEDNERVYFNKHGEWVKRDVPEIYNSYVYKTCYYYPN